MHSSDSLASKIRVYCVSIVRALRLLPRFRTYDAVWIYRGLLLAGPAVLERLAAASGARMLFDFDDAIWITKTMDANRTLAFLKRPQRTAALCRLARAVVVSNETLAGYARSYNRNVTVVPPTVEIERYTPRTHEPPTGPLVVGWSGSPTTIEHMVLVARALQRLALRVRFELRIVGAQYSLPGVEVVVRRWSPENEATELEAFDIGLMPLVDEPWTRGKSAMKGLLYMAAGVPVLASAVEGHRQIGLLAGSDDEWFTKLLALADSVELRRRLGRAGRDLVCRRFTPQVHLPTILQSLETVVGDRARESVRPCR
jgi:glycosyltransferase involved in cell wall biosynthesis